MDVDFEAGHVAKTESVASDRRSLECGVFKGVRKKSRIRQTIFYKKRDVA